MLTWFSKSKPTLEKTQSLDLAARQFRLTPIRIRIAIMWFEPAVGPFGYEPGSDCALLQQPGASVAICLQIQKPIGEIRSEIRHFISNPASISRGLKKQSHLAMFLFPDQRDLSAATAPQAIWEKWRGPDLETSQKVTTFLGSPFLSTRGFYARFPLFVLSS